MEKEGLREVILEGAVVALRRILGCPQYIEMSSSTMLGKAEKVIDFGCRKIEYYKDVQTCPLGQHATYGTAGLPDVPSSAATVKLQMFATKKLAVIHLFSRSLPGVINGSRAFK